MDHKVVRDAIKSVASKIVTVRTGTIVSDNATDSSVQVLLDNDTTNTPVSALGSGFQLAKGTRVSCLAYPGGVLVIGPLTPSVVDSGWRTVGAANEPAFENGWANYGLGGWQTAQYRKIGNRVEVRGLIASGSIGASAFTLPVGYRPVALQMFAAIVATSSANVSTTISGGISGGLNSAVNTGNQNPSGATANHVHSISGHNHNPGTYTGTGTASTNNAGARLDIFTTGAVIPTSGSSNSYFSIWAWFYTD